jgi:hypothetical protein
MTSSEEKKFIAIPLAVLLSVYLMFSSGCSKTEAPKPQSTPKTQSVPTAEVAVSKSNWEYGENVDKMSGKVTNWAMSNSTNKIAMKFPYNGGSEGTIIAFEKNVKLFFTKGQVMCSNYSGCRIQVKFDDEKPELYNAVGPDNGQSNHVYLGQEFNEIKGARQFLEKLKTAKRVMISVEMYQENSPVWEFNVAGFQPK